MHRTSRVTEHPVTGWHITTPEGQHTAWVPGDRHDAVAHAHRLLAGTGTVVTDDD